MTSRWWVCALSVFLCAVPARADEPELVTEDSVGPLRNNPWAGRDPAYLRDKRWTFEREARAGEHLVAAGWVVTGVHFGVVVADLVFSHLSPGFSPLFEAADAAVMGVWVPFGVAGWGAIGTRRALELEGDDRRLIPTVIVHRKREAARGLALSAGLSGATAAMYVVNGVLTTALSGPDECFVCVNRGLPFPPIIGWSVASLTFGVAAATTLLRADLNAHRFGIDPTARPVEVSVVPVVDPRGGGHLTVLGRF